MASNWLYIDTNFPTFTGEESTEEKVTTIQNYMFMLVEQLRYTLHNLDLGNMNTAATENFQRALTDPIYARIEDDEGNLAQLAVTAAGIASRVRDAEGNISSLQQTATAISATVTNQGGDIASLKLTANALTSTVQNQAGDISQLKQTASSLTSTVQNQAGDISQLKQTATSLTSTVQNHTGSISTLQQTATSLTSTVQNQAGDISQLKQTATSLTSTVQNHTGSISSLQQTASNLQTQVSNAAGAASVAQQTANSITFTVTNGNTDWSGNEYSQIALYRNGVLVRSQNIVFSGMVTFTDLSTKGYSTINGGNITTGTIMANNVGVSNSFSLYSGGYLYGYMGCGYGMDGNGNYTYGAQLSSANGYNYLIATNAGVRMTASGTSLYCVSGGPHATANLIVDSDRRVKHDVEYDMDRYEKFFMALRPCRYRYNNEHAGRLHTGFIAQDVEEALNKGELWYDDFAGLTKNPRLDPEYSLAYGEFAALNTYMIQRLMRRVEELERRIA